MVMREKKAVSAETFICIGAIILLFAYIGSVMGVSQMFDTIMNTAHGLLLDTVFLSWLFRSSPVLFPPCWRNSV